MVFELAASDTALILLALCALLNALAIGGVVFFAWNKGNSQSGRWRYVLLGGILGFLAGASISGIMVMDAFAPGEPFDFRVLPMVFCFSLFPAFLSAGLVYKSLWSSKRHRRFLASGNDDKASEED